MYTVQISMHFLVKFGVLEWLYFVQCRPDKHQRDSVNLGFLFLTSGSHVIYPIINVLVPSPTWFEIRQLLEQSPNHVLIYLLISKSTSSSISASVS